MLKTIEIINVETNEPIDTWKNCCPLQLGEQVEYFHYYEVVKILRERCLQMAYVKKINK